MTEKTDHVTNPTSPLVQGSAVRNEYVFKVLADVGVELRQTAERWSEDPAQQEAIASIDAIRRILEAVGEAVRLRPHDNPISSVTAATVTAAAVGVDKAADAATSSELQGALRSAALRLRKGVGASA